MNQKGLAPLIIILGLTLIAGGIIGGSYYIKNHTQLLSNASSEKTQPANPNFSIRTSPEPSSNSFNDDQKSYLLLLVNLAINRYYEKHGSVPDKASDLDFNQPGWDEGIVKELISFMQKDFFYKKDSESVSIVCSKFMQADNAYAKKHAKISSITEVDSSYQCFKVSPKYEETKTK